MNEEVRPFSDIINKAFDNIHVSDMNRAMTIYDTWNNVLQKIRSARNPNEGRNLCEHSRILDLKKDVLIIEVDHPGWMELLQLHKRFIIKGLNYAGIKVKNLAFKLKGDGIYAGINDSSASKEEIKNTPVETAKPIENMPIDDKKTEEKIALPPALEAIFADLKENMLTNSKK